MIHRAPPDRRRAVRIVAGLAVLVAVSACSANKESADPFGALAEEIDVRVSDAERAETMRSLAEEMERAGRELIDLTLETTEAMAKLVADYESTREEFEQLIDDYQKRRRPIVDSMLARHLQIKELATNEEWKVLAKRGHELTAQVARYNLSMAADKGER